MALHSAKVRVLETPTGKVLTTGGSLDIPLDVSAFVTTSKDKTTKRGLKVLEDFKGIDQAREKLNFMFGSKSVDGRHGHNKNLRSVDFTLSQVKRVGMSHPKVAVQHYDTLIMGWDGVNDETSFKFQKGQTYAFHMGIKSPVVSMAVGSAEANLMESITLDGVDGTDLCHDPDLVCDPVDCRTHTLNIIKKLNNHQVGVDAKLSDFVEITPLFSQLLNIGTAKDYKTYELDYCGIDKDIALSQVSSQYPGKTILRDDATGKLILIQPASEPKPADYSVLTSVDVLKNKCKDCPPLYTKINSGYVYGFKVPGSIVSDSDFNTIAGYVTDSFVYLGHDGTHHVVLAVFENKLEKSAFDSLFTARPGTAISILGKTVEYCKAPSNAITTAWKEVGKCSTYVQKYRIQVPNDCAGDRLAELKQAYPDNNITLISTTNCFSIYEAEVETTKSCKTSCSQALVQQYFESEAPRPFDIDCYWYPVINNSPVVPNVKCGIQFKAKPYLLNPAEVLDEQVPTLYGSTRITNLWGGMPEDDSIFTFQTNKAGFAVTRLDREILFDNLSLRAIKKAFRAESLGYFHNEKRGMTPIEREFTKTYNRINGLERYSDFWFEVEVPKTTGMFDKSYDKIQYHIHAPYGKTYELEAIFKKLAGASGVDFDIR